MRSVSGRVAGRLAGAAFVALVTGTAVDMSGNLAYAANEPALKATISTPAPVAPGAVGMVTYTVTNTTNAPTEGILLNVSLPRQVSLPPDAHCRQTGTNGEGGVLLSCNFSDQMGKLAPGATRTANTPFSIAKDAPRGRQLGMMGVLAVPLRGGEPTEDWRKLDGRNVAWTPITTS